MQTEILPGTRSSWPEWVKFLRQHRLEGMASWVLEALNPLTMLGAQMLHFTTPLLRPALPIEQVKSLAHLLEDPAESRAFAAYLREDPHP